MLVCRHTTSGMGLEPDASGAVHVHMKMGVRIVHKTYINTKSSDSVADAVIEAGICMST